jgi:hypothetical protein
MHRCAALIFGEEVTGSSKSLAINSTISIISQREIARNGRARRGALAIMDSYSQCGIHKSFQGFSPLIETML